MLASVLPILVIVILVVLAVIAIAVYLKHRQNKVAPEEKPIIYKHIIMRDTL